MNAIRATQALNKRELEHAIPPSASWHADYRDTAWVYIGGLPLDLSEGDVVTIFAQFGSPSHLNLIRDRETGKSKGFGFLKYDDQRSCDLAVDNLGGAEVLGRVLRVDHTRYKKKDDEDEDTYRIDRLEAEIEDGVQVNGNGKRASDSEDSQSERTRRKRQRPLLKEEKDLEESLLTQEAQEEDPMREYMIRQRREEVEKARALEKRHRHHHHHRDEREDRKHRHRHRHLSETDSENDLTAQRSMNHDRYHEEEKRHRHRRKTSNKVGDSDLAYRQHTQSPEGRPRARQRSPREASSDKYESNSRSKYRDRDKDEY